MDSGVEATKMDIFVLNDGNTLPAVGLGTSRIKPEEMDEVIRNAIEIGYRHFDSAQLYNTNTAFGKALSKVLSSKIIKREELFITSKTGQGVHFVLAAKLLPSSNSQAVGETLLQYGRKIKLKTGRYLLLCKECKLAFYHNRPEEVRSSLLECLEKLQLDYVDLFLIHHPAGFKEMEKLVADNLTRSIGVSNFNKDQLSQILHNPTIKIQPAVLQTECHVSLQETEMVKFCQDNNIVVTGYAALGSPNINFAGVVGSDIVKNDLVCNMARRYNKSSAQILLRFLIQRRVGVIVKSSNPGRLRENLNIFDFELSAEDFKDLLKLDRNERVFNYPFQLHHPQNPYPMDS